MADVETIAIEEIGEKPVSDNYLNIKKYEGINKTTSSCRGIPEPRLFVDEASKLKSFVYIIINTIATRYFILEIFVLFLRFNHYVSFIVIVVYGCADFVFNILWANSFFIFLCRGKRAKYYSIFEFVLRVENNYEKKRNKWMKVIIILVTVVVAVSFHFVFFKKTDDFECKYWNEGVPQENANASTSSYGFYQFLKIFYYDDLFLGDKVIKDCKFVNDSFLEYYKGFLIGLINIIVLILFRIMTYDGPACDLYVDQLNTVQRHKIFFPRINISILNMLRKTTNKILQEIIFGLYVLKIKKASLEDFHKLIKYDESISHFDFSYFEDLDNFELGFLQFFFIEYYSIVKLKIEADKQKRREEKKEKEQDRNFFKYIGDKIKFSNLSFKKINKFLFNEFFVKVIKSLYKFFISKRVRNLIVITVFAFFVYFFVIFFIEISIIFTRFWVLKGFASNFVVFEWSIFYFVLRVLLYILVLLGMLIITSFLSIFGVLYGDIYEQFFKRFFSYENYMSKVYGLAKGKKRKKFLNETDLKSIKTDSTWKTFVYVMQNLRINLIRGAWRFLVLSIKGYAGIVLIILSFVGTIVFTMFFLLPIVAFVLYIFYQALVYIVIIIIVMKCYFLFNQNVIDLETESKPEFDDEEEEGETDGKGEKKKEKKSMKKTIENFLNELTVMCIVDSFLFIPVMLGSTITVVFKIIEFLLGRERRSLKKSFFNFIDKKKIINFQKRNETYLGKVKKVFEGNVQSMMDQKKEVRRSHKQVKDDVDKEVENDKKREEESKLFSIDEKKKRIKHLYQDVLSFNHRIFVYLKSNRVIRKLEKYGGKKGDGDVNEKMEKEIKHFQFDLGRWFCKQLFDNFPLKVSKFNYFTSKMEEYTMDVENFQKILGKMDEKLEGDVDVDVELEETEDKEKDKEDKGEEEEKEKEEEDKEEKEDEKLLGEGE